MIERLIPCDSNAAFAASRTLIIIVFVIFSIILASCKIAPDKDTTSPVVNLTIEGGNEISRGVKLYLHVEDDSKIDYVEIMIDDTTALAVESNFDTIRFDITPFADDSDHILYAKVSDQEGNVGESEKLDVVITEYPGWRIYKSLVFGDPYDTPIVIDEKGVLLIGSGYDLNGLFIFNPETEEIKNYNKDNSPLTSKYIIDLQLIADGSVWIATHHDVIEFLYELNYWGRRIDLPRDRHGYLQEISTLLLGPNTEMWIGTWVGGLFHYKGIELERHYYIPEITSIGVHDLIIDNNNRLYVAPESNSVININGVYSIFDSEITTYDFFNVNGIWGELLCIAADSSNNIWVAGGGPAYKYNGNTWENVEQSAFNPRFDPMLVTKEGILFTQGAGTGLISWDGFEWTDYSIFDTPFKDEINNELYIAGQSLVEAPDGDIWMVAGGKLMRYRPSLGAFSK